MACNIVPLKYVYDSGSESDEENIPPVIHAQSPPNDENLCIICADRKSNVLFMPCRHLKTCAECSSLLAAQNETQLVCPMCKQRVSDTIIVFV
jgi:primosomal protein N'